MNSVRVLPRIAAASSISCRVLASMRRLMLPFVSAADERLATATAASPKLSEDDERSFGIDGIYALYLQCQYRQPSAALPSRLQFWSMIRKSEHRFLSRQ